MGRWTTGVESPDDPTRPMAKPAPDSEILIIRIRAGILLGFGAASVIVCLWRRYEFFLPLWIGLGYTLQALISYAQPFGHDMKRGNLPEAVRE